jgi:hypothetical protein
MVGIPCEKEHAPFTRDADQFGYPRAPSPHPRAVDENVTQERAVQDVGVRRATARIVGANRKQRLRYAYGNCN